MSQFQVSPIRARRSLAALGIAATIGLGACTGAGATPVPTAAPTAAPTAPGSAAVDLAAEVDATIAGLESALTKYRAGDKQGALDAIAKTYEEHFELVEHPLDEIDHEFMENLEELIAVKTRAVIQDGKPVSDLEALVNEAKTLLAQAKDMLT